MNKKNIVEDNSIEFKIEKLKSQIKNCEYDLEDKFKGNITIESKLDNLKMQLKKLEKQQE